MEEEYWRRFLASGKIMDYLYYKGLGICKQVMDSYTGGAAGLDRGFTEYEDRDSGKSDYSDRHGACGDACW